MRTNIDRLVGGATEETIVARVGEGIVTTIGSAENHMQVLENPDRISKVVLERGLDAGTAFEILSINIADIDVGENIGARLRIAQAEADKQVAQAQAERQRALAVAREQEMIALVQENRAKVVLAEAEVPKAMADAFRSGNLGVMDYYQMQNVMADPTDDPTHGAQQLSFFNAHYDTWCYLPMAGFIQFDDEPEQYLFAYVLRPGNANAKLGAIGILRRALERLRRAFPKAKVLVRLDGGFAGPEMYEFLEAEGVDYAVAMAENKVLTRFAEALMKQVRRMSKRSGETERLYGECRYAAGSWNRERRVIFKAEVVRLGGREPKDNARFVVTNLRRVPQRVYEAVYCQHANIENRIKELHYGLAIDRTSCTSVWANQMRVMLTAAAYVLMQELRLRAAGTSLARAQVTTLRERLFKLGAWLERSVRRVVIHLPQRAPWRSEWCRVAHADALEHRDAGSPGRRACTGLRPLSLLDRVREGSSKR